ncbi:MAG: hypothetical protein A3D67_00930 [Candidatus Lloydbacteria bacterium RIFCSPHIGHO2_02_FULL_51_22]|uniref:DUF7151 domain-containing protein n=1 Tax=Candidatus Lloydbacteria bacterium RIFCSPHIGHO2_02_FULL_51_22 TaxID=1798663 RepID=A0A1G2DA45_9BACT|nr:MAG: hypothetical protein A3D67_00930 [Candidatus Lloydbacteria bacterium RIFCSPHIGHO2_02_FULL_51_22]
MQIDYLKLKTLMRQKTSLTFIILLSALVLFVGTAKEVFAVEIGGNSLENVAGTEFQLLPGQSDFPLAPPAYYLKIIENMGLRLSPTTVSGTPNASPNDIARFGIGKDPTAELDVLGTIAGDFLKIFGVGSNGLLRWDNTSGQFQWALDTATPSWNAFGGGGLETELDPVYSAAPASGITGTKISNWDTAFGWGNHATEGYLTSFTESDPGVQAFAKTANAIPTCLGGQRLTHNGLGVLTCAPNNDADASATNEIQNVIADQGLRTDGATVPSFGLIQCVNDGYVLKWNNTSSTWGCAPDADSATAEEDPKVGALTANYIPRWGSSDALTDSIISEGSGKIGVGVTAGSIISPLTVQGDVAAGSFTTAGTVSADSGVFTRGGNIGAQAVFSTNFKYVAGDRTLAYATPRCNTSGTAGKLNCDINNTLLDCGSGNYDIGADPGSAPPTCYDQYLSIENAPAKQAYTLVSSETTGGWVTGNTGFGDTISIGGDSGLTNPDAEIRINAPTNRNLVSFTNPSVAGGLADIRAKQGFFSTLILAGNSTYTVSLSAPSSLSENKTFTLPSGYGTSGQFLKTDGNGILGWDTGGGGGLTSVSHDGTLTGDGATTALGVDISAEATRVSNNSTVAGHTTTLGTLGTTVSGHTTTLGTLGTTVAGHTTTIAGKQNTLTSSNAGTGISISGSTISLSSEFLGSVRYQGTWNASSNSPPLSAPPAATTKGNYYAVSTAGTRFSTSWAVGDYIVSNGSVWEKVTNTDLIPAITAATTGWDKNVSDDLTGGGIAGKIAKWSGATALGSSVITESAAGSVGIGTAAPVSKLEVAGTILSNALGTIGNAVFGGKVGVKGGTTYGQDYALDVNGDALIANRGGTLGSELAANGNFSSGQTSWSFGSGWTEVGAAQHISGTAALSQTIPTLEAGKPYRVTFDMTGRTAGNATPFLGGAAGILVNINGTTITQTIIPSTSGGTISFTPTSGFNGTIDNVSVKKITGGNLYATGNIRSDSGFSVGGTSVIDANGNWVGASTGLVGADGAKWFTGTAVPNTTTDETGGVTSGSVVGDFYLRTGATGGGDVYRKIASGWGAATVGNIKGADGTSGASGYTSLVKTTAEDPGTNCTVAGLKIEAGLDDGTPSGTANNGTLEAGEVIQTGYICDGAQGTNGTNGTPGATWLSSSGAPAAADGAINDFYLNTANGDVYKKTNASTWTLQTNITGPLVAGTANQTLRYDTTAPAGWKATSDFSVTSVGVISGKEGFTVSYPTTGVYGDAESAPYSRVNADSFHTNSLGVGQLFIEGRAIDSNLPIYIGAGVAGGQSAQNTYFGGNVGIGTAAPMAKLEVKGNTGTTVTTEARILADTPLRRRLYLSSGFSSDLKIGDAVKVVRILTPTDTITTIILAISADRKRILLATAVPALGVSYSGETPSLSIDPYFYTVTMDPTLFAVRNAANVNKFSVDKNGGVAAGSIVANWVNSLGGFGLKLNDSDNSNTITLKAPAGTALTSNLIWTLPSYLPTGGVTGLLKTDNMGNLSWETMGATTSINAMRSNVALNVTSPAARTAANHAAYPTSAPYGLASLDTNQKILVSELPDAVVGGTRYKGTWNATTDKINDTVNALLPVASGDRSTGNTGDFYVVTVEGDPSTGNASAAGAFKVGDYVISNGGSWTRIDNSDVQTKITNWWSATSGSFQASDTDLTAIAGLSASDNNFIVGGSGGAWTVESGSTARTSLGLGTLATRNSINLTSHVGSTILPLRNGGTGFSSYATGDIIWASGVNTLSKFSASAATADGVLLWDYDATSPTLKWLDSNSASLGQVLGVTANGVLGWTSGGKWEDGTNYATNKNITYNPAAGTDVTGNVGIGTASPTAKLEVTGGVKIVQEPATLTQLNGSINDSVTTITVDSTAGYPSAGTLLIDSEAITYTGITTTTFTGLTRGALGTTAAAHSDNAVINNFLFTALSTATTPRMVVTSAGNVGINTPVFAGTMLNIKQSVASQTVGVGINGFSDSDATLQFCNENSGKLCSYVRQIYDTGGISFSGGPNLSDLNISPEGNVGIGRQPIANSALSVLGVVGVQGDLMVADDGVTKNALEVSGTGDSFIMGNVGIGTNDSNDISGTLAKKVNVYGGVRVVDGGILMTSSLLPISAGAMAYTLKNEELISHSTVRCSSKDGLPNDDSSTLINIVVRGIDGKLISYPTTEGVGDVCSDNYKVDTDSDGTVDSDRRNEWVVVSIGAQNANLIGGIRFQDLTRAEDTWELFNRNGEFLFQDAGGNNNLTLTQTGNVDIAHDLTIGGESLSLADNLFLEGTGETVRITNNAYINDSGSFVIKDTSKKAATIEIRDNPISDGVGSIDFYGTLTNGQLDWRRMMSMNAVDNKVIVDGMLSVGGNTTLSSTLNVTGATTLSSTLNVTGNATIGGRIIGAARGIAVYKVDGCYTRIGDPSNPSLIYRECLVTDSSNGATLAGYLIAP